MSARQSTGARKVAKGEYIETDSGNKVSRRALITGTANITLAGKTVIQSDVHLRGDLTRTKEHWAATHSTKDASASSQKTPAQTAISIGRYTVISSGCVIKPPGRTSRGVWTYYPMKIGDNVFIGANSQVSAIDIKSHVHVGEGSVLGPFVMVRENVKILPGTVVPSHMVIPPGVVVGGRPARIIRDVDDGWGMAPGGAGSGEWVEGGDLRELVRSIK